MELKVEIIGLKGVEDALSQAGSKLAKRALRKALKAGGATLLSAAKRNAPILAKASPNRRPGELRDALDMTVKLSPREESGTARIGIKRIRSKDGQSPTVWSSFVEFGTKDTSAQPFMRPAYDAAKNAAQEAFTEEIREGVETLGKRS